MLRILTGLMAFMLVMSGRGTINAEPSETPTGAGDPGPDLRLSRCTVQDPAAGCDAFSILLPQGWISEGGAVWRPNFSTQAAIQWRASAPDHSVSLSILPCDPFVWNSARIPFFDEGTNYLGSEVRRPVEDVASFITTLVLPRYRPRVSKARVTAVTLLPDIAQTAVEAMAEPDARKQGLAARVRVEYNQNGADMEEDFFCVLLFATPLHASYLTFWGPDSLYSFRTRRGCMDKHEAVLGTMISSLRISPEWFNIVAQVQQQFIDGQMKAIPDAGPLSKIIAGTNRDISAMIRDRYETRNAASDRITRQFSDTLRGIGRYHNSRGTEVALPSSYRQVWGISSGEYILSDDPRFSPNRDDGTQWEQMHLQNP